MKKSEIIKLLILRTVGNFLILAMIAGFLATFGPAVYFEANYRIEKLQGISYQIVNAQNTSEIIRILSSNIENNTSSETDIKTSDVKLSDYPSLFVSSDNPNEKIIIPKSTEFSLVIPKIGINEKVFENIDPFNPSVYLEVLKKGIAHAKGTVFPGVNGTTYIFAHSADNFWNVGRYNAVFYLLNKLEKNDNITIFFKDKRYDYKVIDQKVVNADDVKYLNANPGKGEKLILQTCWPPGTTWKRLLIRAEPDYLKL